MTPAGLPPVGLKCAHLDNPLAVAPDRVRFSWLPASGGLQQAYQIQVFPNEGSRLPQATPLWDSGQAPSGESADVPYGGPPLTAGGCQGLGQGVLLGPFSERPSISRRPVAEFQA